MDPLARILESTRARSPLIADLHLGSDVSLGMPHLPAIPFHYVLDGQCRLRSGPTATAMEAGDLVLLPRWPDYRVETGEGSEQVEITDVATHRSVPANYLRTGVGRPLREMIGEGARGARVLSGIVSPVEHGDGPLLRALPDVVLLRNTAARMAPLLDAATAFLSTESSAPSPGFSAVADRLVELIFIATLRDWMLQARREAGWERQLTDASVARAIDAMHDDPARRWTLHDLAAAAGRSRSGFAAHFKAVMGEPPFAYLARWRMRLASDLVREGRLSTAEVGVTLGYRSLHGFSQAFLAAFGETPAQHRRRDHQARGNA